MTEETESPPSAAPGVDFDVDYLTPDKQKDIILKYIQEKEQIQQKYEEAAREVTKKKSDIYDLKNEISELKSEMKGIRKENDTLKSNLAKSRPTTSKRGSSILGRGGNKKTPSKKGSTLTKSTTQAIPVATPAPSRPSSGNEGKKAEKKEAIPERFVMIAEKFPLLKLVNVLKAEYYFNKADTNGDGTVDEDELEILLDQQGLLVTKKLVKDVMNEIDKDNNKTIDMMEYLAILEKLQERRATNLPSEVKNSQACSIQ